MIWLLKGELTAFVGAKKVYFLPSSAELNLSSNCGSGLSGLVPIPAITAFNVDSSGSAAIALSRVRADAELIRLSKCVRYSPQTAITSSSSSEYEGYGKE